MEVAAAVTVPHQVAILGDALGDVTAGEEVSFVLCSLHSDTNKPQGTGGDCFQASLQLLPGTSTLAMATKAGLQIVKKRMPAGQVEIHKLSPSDVAAAAKLAGDYLPLACSKLTHVELWTPKKKKEEDNITIVVHTVVLDEGDGTYTVRYVLPVAGVYLLRIWKNGVPLPFLESNQLIHVGAGQVNGSTTVMSGRGLARAEAGVEASFKLQACDSHGNSVSGDGVGSRFSILIYKEFVPPEQEEDTLVPFEAQDLGGGQCWVTYMAELEGSYILEVQLDGEAVPELQRRIHVSATMSDHSKSQLSGKGLHRAVAGYVAAFSIKTLDRFGNTCTKGGDNFMVTLQLVHASPGLNQELPRGPIVLKAVDNDDGTYQVYYCLKVAGKFLLRVNYSNDPKNRPLIHESHIEVLMDVPFASRCIATGAGLSSPSSNVQAKISVAVHDEYGNSAPLGYKPPADLLFLGKDLQVILHPHEMQQADLMDKPALRPTDALSRDNSTRSQHGQLGLYGSGHLYEAKLVEGYYGLVAGLTSADTGKQLPQEAKCCPLV
mmetsp:Transcript_38973/g.110373  ORF Transcript_38973/g.110373 Transcript_38973/m.110373 type:complete len:547 (+) Transcript_38973:21-1661(+)